MIQMKTYMMTLKRMMMTVLMMLITVSAMRAEQKIWLHISGNGKAQVSLGETVLTFDKDNMAPVKEDAPGKTVTVSVKPDNGYKVASVTAQLTTSADNADTRGADDAGFLDVKKASDTEYTFEMPKDFNVRIYVTISKKESGSKGTSPEITTDTSDKKLYLIQTNQFESFYMVPTSDGVNATTNNIPNAQMLWYFEDAGKDGDIQYYYIVSNSTNKYICHGGGTANNDTSRGVTLVEKDASNEERCKFKLVEDNSNGTNGFFNIDAKGNPTYYGLNKRNGSVNTSYPIRLTNTQYIHEYNSKWKFIQYNDTFTWPDPPFTPSTTDQKYYFKIHNVVNGDYYVSSDASSPKNVTIASTASDKMVWYFKEADSSDPWIKYYYIVNPEAGEYMYYKGTVTNGSNQSNAIILKEKNSDNEDRFQFIVVQTARTVNDEPVECYTIIPKLLNDKYWASNCISPTSIEDGNKLGIRNGRGSADNNSHWLFEPTTYAKVWADPVIDCDENGTITITQSEGADVRYTISHSITPPDNPTSSNDLFDDNDKPSAGTGFTTIKAIAIGGEKNPSNVVTKTIVYNPTISLGTGDETYSGTAKVPVVKVGDTEIASTEYNIAFEKGGVAADFKDAGDYTIELSDVDGGDYIVYGSGSLTINKKALTATAENKEVAYGSAAPTYTVNYSGFVTGEDATNLSTAPTATCIYTATSNVGTYEIVPSGGAAANYSFSYVNGTLTVTTKAVTITASDASKEYDGTALTKAEIIAPALEEGDTHKFTIVMTEESTITNVGTQPNVIATVDGVAVSTGTETAVGNYLVTTADGTLTINKRPVTITSGIKVSEKTYDGTTAATLDCSEAVIDGKIGEDDLTVTATGVFAGKDVVISEETVQPIEVAISKENLTLGGEKVANYKLADDGHQAMASAKINPAPLTIKANDKTISYGDAPDNAGVTFGEDDGNGGTINDFVNNEDNTVLGGTLSYIYNSETDGLGDPYTTTSPQGTFYIIPSGLTSTNYTITFKYGTLTVGKKELNKDENGTPADDITIDVTKNSNGNYVVTVTQGGQTLEEGDVDGDKKDFTWEDGTSDANGIVEITITGQGNYGGVVKAKYVNLDFYDDTPNDPTKTETAAVFFTTEDLQSVGEIEAWYVSAVNSATRELTITKVETTSGDNYILANQPLLLLGNADSKGFMLKPYTGTETVTIGEGENLLKMAPEGGVSVPNKGVYVFHEGEFVLSMWGDSQKISAGHFYVNLTGSPAPTRMAIVKSNANTRTGIVGITEDCNKETQNETWYTLDGRRLNMKPTQKGIYITNDQKVIIK